MLQKCTKIKTDYENPGSDTRIFVCCLVWAQSLHTKMKLTARETKINLCFMCFINLCALFPIQPYKKREML